MNVNAIPLVQRVASVLWPSFIVASIANAIFFSVFDPDIIFIDFEISRMGAYSIGFFCCWLMTGGSCLMTFFLLKPCESICNKHKTDDK
jgi:hypothetical protein